MAPLRPYPFLSFVQARNLDAVNRFGVLVAATRASAELMRLDDLGTVEAGKSADFLVLEASPLEDLTNTRRISAV